jgi:hypothetical protein
VLLLAVFEDNKGAGRFVSTKPGKQNWPVRRIDIAVDRSVSCLPEMPLPLPVLFAVALSVADVKAYLHSIAPMFENVSEPAVVVQQLPKKGIPFVLQFRILGEYDPKTNTIIMSLDVLKGGRSDEMMDVLVHEMAHAWIAANNIHDSDDHGPAFRKKYQEACERLGRKRIRSFGGT